MRHWVMAAVLALQVFHVLFLLLHDWVPLGRWNDVRALREVYPAKKVILSTILSSAPFVALLWSSYKDLGMMRYPLGLRVWLWIGYGFLFMGELQAWWVPYLRGGEPERAERYRVMFGDTYGFLPERHGIRPNALHVVLHTATLCLLLLLFGL